MGMAVSFLALCSLRGPLSSLSDSTIRLALPPAAFPRLLPTSPRLSLSHLADMVVTRRKSYASDSEVHRCEFINISNPDASGGAIRSSARIRIVNTLFRGCDARSGGAIALSNSASLQLVTADCCSAGDSGAVEMRTEETHTCDFTLTLFIDVSANYYGAVYRNSWGKFLVESSNFTRPSASSCVGCMEADYGGMTMQFSVVCGAVAGRHNGALSTRHLYYLRIESCRFEVCAQVSRKAASAAVLLVYDCPQSSIVRRCAFVDIETSASRTITVAQGHVLSVVQCCFSGKRKSELPKQGITVRNCSFAVENCAARMAFANVSAGYNPMMTAPPFTTDAAGDPRRRRSHLELFARATIAGLIFAAVMIVGQSIVRRGIGSGERRRKAFQGQ